MCSGCVAETCCRLLLKTACAWAGTFSAPAAASSPLSHRQTWCGTHTEVATHSGRREVVSSWCSKAGGSQVGRGMCSHARSASCPPQRPAAGSCQQPRSQWCCPYFCSAPPPTHTHPAPGAMVRLMKVSSAPCRSSISPLKNLPSSSSTIRAEPVGSRQTAGRQQQQLTDLPWACIHQPCCRDSIINAAPAAASRHSLALPPILSGTACACTPLPIAAPCATGSSRTW